MSMVMRLRRIAGPLAPYLWAIVIPVVGLVLAYGLGLLVFDLLGAGYLRSLLHRL